MKEVGKGLVRRFPQEVLLECVANCTKENPVICDSLIQSRHQSLCHDVELGQKQWFSWAGCEMTYVGQTQGVWEEEKALKND